MRAKQTGFTLIELVIVIVILGILAATALPRFVNLQADARNAKVRGAEGAIRGAAAIAHATFLARGVAPAGSINMDGVTINLCNGYPVANSNDGITDAAQLDETGGDWALGGTQGNTGSSSIIIDEAGDTSTNCRVTYTAAAGTGTAVNCNEPGNAPTIAVAAACN